MLTEIISCILIISTRRQNFSLIRRRTIHFSVVQLNRGSFPANFKVAKLVRGESIYLKSLVNTGSFLDVHWYNKRVAFALSTIHGVGSTDVHCRGDGESYPKPAMINEYNNDKRGVDKLGQKTSSYSCNKKLKKWQKVSFVSFRSLLSMHWYCIRKPFQPFQQQAANI